MNLHEIYKTLMRRGMPKHRDLVWTAFAEPCVACALNGDVAILTTNTAHDLIAMHALRWFYAAVDPEAIIERYNGPTRPTGNKGPGFALQYMLNGEGWDVFRDTILDCILAATAHLEPKGDDDATKS